MGVHPWKRLACACMRASSRSVTRSNECSKKRLLPALKQLHQLLTKGLQATAELWPPLEQVYRFLDQAKTILANELQDTGQQVRERYLAHLARMRDDLPVLGQLSEAFEHFCHITDNFAAGLFRCYDIAGIPRTNNDLERCFGVARVGSATRHRSAGSHSWRGGSWVRSRYGFGNQQRAGLFGGGATTQGLAALAGPAATITPAGGGAQAAMALSQTFCHVFG